MSTPTPSLYHALLAATTRDGGYDPVSFGGCTYEWMSCPDCQGTGTEFGRRGSLDDVLSTCFTCDGSGMVFDGDEETEG